MTIKQNNEYLYLILVKSYISHFDITEIQYIKTIIFIINNFISWKVYVGLTFGHIRKKCV